MCTKIDRIVCLFLLACLASIKLYFFYLFKPILFRSHVDDNLYITLANNIAHGTWLGTFGSLTLAKAPGYPLWLAMEHFFGLHCMSAEHIVYFAAILLLYLALVRANIKPAIVAFSMLFFIISPELFDFNSMRILRSLLYDSLTLLIVSLCILSLQATTWRTIAFLTLIYSCLMGFYYLVREEFVWILPVHAVFAGCFFWTRERGNKHTLCMTLAVGLLPLLNVMAVDIGVKAVNHYFYNVSILYTQRDGNFPKAMGALQRIKMPIYRQYLPVPQEARLLAYKVSPIFEEIRSPLDENDVAAHLKLVSCSHAHILCNDYPAQDVYWDIVYAAEEEHKYDTAEHAENFYGAIAQEINNACDSGSIVCLPPHDTLYPIFQREMIPDIPSAARSVLEKLFHPVFLYKPYTKIGSVSYINFKELFPSDDYINTGAELKAQEELRLFYGRQIAHVWPLIVIFALAGAPLYLMSRIYVCRRRPDFCLNEKVIISAVTIVLTAIICRLVLLTAVTVTSWEATYGYMAQVYGLVSMLFIVLLARFLDYFKDNGQPLY